MYKMNPGIRFFRMPIEIVFIGLTRIRSTCEMARLPLPNFEFDDYNFSITINCSEVEFGELGEVLDVPVNVPVNQRQQLILLGISKSGSIQMKTLRNKFRDVSDRTLKRDIEQLKRLELIIFLGPPKTGKYVLTEKGKKIFKV